MVLLHEMIHAHNMTLRIRDPDPGGHGPPFVQLMEKINKSTVPDQEVCVCVLVLWEGKSVPAFIFKRCWSWS